VTPSDLRAGEIVSSADRLLGCGATPLNGLPLPRRGTQDRIERLLEGLVAQARASVGAILLADADGALHVRASCGVPDSERAPLRSTLDGVSFGLAVHGAEIDGQAPHDDATCRHPAFDPEARMTLCLPLEGARSMLGVACVEFRELRSLQPAEVRQLATQADHIAAVCDAEQLAAESANRQAEIERVSGVLEEIDRMKGDFLSMISHELRTPLTAIIGYTDLLLRQIHGTLNDRQAHHQQAVKKAAHRLLDLINDLLDLNRLESGNVALALDDLSLAEAISRAAHQTTVTAEQRGVEIRLDLPLTTVAVRADAERLHQILVNLLDNAIKFTPANGSVTVRADLGHDTVTVSVIDMGVGVPPDQLERIWDRFHQADSSTRRQFGGTGLGLAIVRHLVELHDGTVSVASPGENLGSTFSFTLPTTEAAVLPAAVTPGTPVAEADPPSSRTVLIVDDEPDNREVITSIVRDVLGHTVLTASNGREALDRASRHPDLVLLDLRMPGMSGFDVARTLKQQSATADIPILAITALDDEDDRRDAMDAGCIGCVTKPFSEEALATAVSTTLGHAGPIQER
jgi:signal transduction histidine kinase/CheY-like chemotaxis protein